MWLPIHTGIIVIPWYYCLLYVSRKKLTEKVWNIFFVTTGRRKYCYMIRMGDSEVNKDLYLSLRLAHADILDESIGYLMRAMKRSLHIETYWRNATNLEFNKRGRCCHFHSRISQYIFVHPRNRIQSVNNDRFHKCSLARNSGDAANKPMCSEKHGDTNM